MKKSNILLLIAVAFFVCCLTAYNFKIKEVYESGNYKDPFFNYKELGYKGFDEVEVNGGTKLNVRITPGDHQVRIHDQMQEYVHINQEGNKLVVDVSFKDKKMRMFPDPVLISCPRLASVTTSSGYTLAGQKDSTLSSGIPFYFHVFIDGFSQDSLLINQDHATSVQLKNNTLAKLTAVISRSPESKSKLSLDGSNKIQSAELNVQNKGVLEMENIFIPALSYQFSDNAQATFTGASLQIVRKN